MNPRVRETGLGASHRFIVSTTVQLRSSKLEAAHRGAEASWPMKGVIAVIAWPWSIELARSFRGLRASELVFPEQF